MGHWIHDGPNTKTDAYGSYGCIEMCGQKGMAALKNYIIRISGSSKTASNAMTEITNMKMLKVVIIPTIKPTISNIGP